MTRFRKNDFFKWTQLYYFTILYLSIPPEAPIIPVVTTFKTKTPFVLS